MRSREKLNDELRKDLANLIAKEMLFKNALVTISFVDCAPDLSFAKVAVSVLPDTMSDSVIKKLNGQSHFFCQALKKSTKLRRIPKFKWVADETEKNAAVIDEIFKQIENDK
jgi:ribosome-binding factor A